MANTQATGLIDTDGSVGTDEMSENQMEEVAMYHQVVQIGQQSQHVPIISGSTIISTAGFGNTTTTTNAGVNDTPFYVVMTPNTEVLGHTVSNPNRRRSANDHHRNTRDEKRRATHNEVERRRRDKINNWIMRLAKVVPDCNVDHTKQGQSKGGILAKACEYITEITDENNQMHEIVKTNNNLINDLERMKRDLAETKKENSKLKSVLQKHGLLNDALEAVQDSKDSCQTLDGHQEAQVITNNVSSIIVPPSVVVTFSSSQAEPTTPIDGSGHSMASTASPTPSS